MPQVSDKILRLLFRKAEVSCLIYDMSKAVAPIVDLMFISQFIGTSGVTVWVLCLQVSFILGARDPEIFAMTKLYILGYIVGLPFFMGAAYFLRRKNDSVFRLSLKGATRNICGEIAIFLAEHGFNDGRLHNINARLVAKGDNLIIRMRDDCKPFNLTEYYKALTESRERNAGLSIIVNDPTPKGGGFR